MYSSKEDKSFQKNYQRTEDEGIKDYSLERKLESTRLEASEKWAWNNIDNINWKYHKNVPIRKKKAMIWTHLERRDSSKRIF